MRIATFYAPRRVANNPGPLRLVLGPVHHAEVGTPIRYYFDGFALSESYEDIEFSHSGPGTMHSDRWEWTPDTPGDRILTIRDNLGGRVSQRIIVHPDSGAGSIVTLHNGDSITAPTGGWPGQNRARLVSAGVDVTMRGTRQSTPTPEADVYHEGYPGRSYHWMLTSDPNVPPSSPFVIGESGGTYDLAQYMEDNPGPTPTIVTWAYGTNDVGPASLESYVVDIVDDAEMLWESFRAEMPEAQLAFFLMYNVLNDDAAWQPPSIPYVLWEYRQRRHRFLELMIERFYGRPNTHLLNTHACIAQSQFAGNNVHPQISGHTQIVDQIYPWHRHIARLAA